MENNDNEFWMNARYDGKCHECEEEIFEGDRIVFNRVTRKIYCKTCGVEAIGTE